MTIRERLRRLVRDDESEGPRAADTADDYAADDEADRIEASAAVLRAIKHKGFYWPGEDD